MPRKPNVRRTENGMTDGKPNSIVPPLTQKAGDNNPTKFQVIPFFIVSEKSLTKVCTDVRTDVRTLVKT